MEERTLERDMTKNIAPWPQDWDMHLMKTFQFYFNDNEQRTDPPVIWHKMHAQYRSYFEELNDPEAITYGDMRENIDLWSIDFRCIFTCGEGFYLVLAVRKDETSIISNVFIFTHIVSSYSEMEEGEIAVPGKSGFMVAIPIGSITSTSPFVMAESVEKMISDDYWKRRNGGEGDDDDSPVTDPSDLLTV